TPFGHQSGKTERIRAVFGTFFWDLPCLYIVIVVLQCLFSQSDRANGVLSHVQFRRAIIVRLLLEVRDGTLLCLAQLPGAPDPVAANDVIGINSNHFGTEHARVHDEITYSAMTADQMIGALNGEVSAESVMRVLKDFVDERLVFREG